MGRKNRDEALHDSTSTKALRSDGEMAEIEQTKELRQRSRQLRIRGWDAWKDRNKERKAQNPDCRRYPFHPQSCLPLVSNHFLS